MIQDTSGSVYKNTEKNNEHLIAQS